MFHPLFLLVGSQQVVARNDVSILVLFLFFGLMRIGYSACHEIVKYVLRHFCAIEAMSVCLSFFDSSTAAGSVDLLILYLYIPLEET